MKNLFSPLMLIINLLVNVAVFAQNDKNNESENESNYSQDFKEDLNAGNIGEEIMLDTVKKYGLSEFNTPLEAKYYSWLKKKIFTVYPYLTKAVEEYKQVSMTEKQFTNDRERKNYIKTKQEELAKEYEEKLKNLTHTEGIIFVKLMHRDTGKTVAEIISELRGGWSAFWWKAKAGFAGVDLEEKLNPEEVRQDLFIEVILQKAFASGELKEIRN